MRKLEDEVRRLKNALKEAENRASQVIALTTYRITGKKVVLNFHGLGPKTILWSFILEV